MRQGILIVSFGTTYGETRERNIERIAEAVRESFPDRNVCQAYSSSTVRDILKTRDDITVQNTEEALHRLKDSGVTQVTVLPTHIIDGIENNRMKRAIEGCRGLFDEIRIAGVLLGGKADYELTAKALWEELEEAAGDTPVILMGHGSAHEADNSYTLLEKELRDCSGKEIYIATVEGSVTIDSVIGRLKASVPKRGRVLLLPFMLVAGDHAVHDMAGEGASFASKLRAEGYEPECVLKGIGEYEGIRNIYIRHLREALE